MSFFGFVSLNSFLKQLYKWLVGLKINGIGLVAEGENVHCSAAEGVLSVIEITCYLAVFFFVLFKFVLVNKVNGHFKIQSTHNGTLSAHGFYYGKK